MEKLKNSFMCISTSDVSTTACLLTIKRLASHQLEILRRQMDVLDLLAVKNLPKSYHDFQGGELRKLRLLCERLLREEEGSPYIRLVEVLLRVAAEHSQFMVDYFLEAEQTILRSASNKNAEGLMLKKRFFIFQRIITEVYEGFLNIRHTQSSDLFLQPADSIAWQQLKLHTFEIETDSKIQCLQAYTTKMLDGFAVLASIGKAAQRVPKTDCEMDSVFACHTRALDKVYAGPHEFASKLDSGAREKCDQFSARFFVRVFRYMLDPQKCAIDGNFMIAQADYRIFNLFLHMTDKRPVRFFRDKFEYPSVEYNLKFYLQPDYLKSFFSDDGQNPITLRTPLVNIPADDLLSPASLLKDSNKIKVRFICDVKIIHFTMKFDIRQLDPNYLNAQKPDSARFISSVFEPAQFHEQTPKAWSAAMSIRSSTSIRLPGLSHDTSAFPDTVLVYIHGGGFTAMSSSSHQNYLRVWAKSLKIPIFCIDYRLAPVVKYPQLFNDVIRCYIWVLAFITGTLKLNPRKVILSGDSAGGNLAAVLTTWCLENGVRVPDHLVLHYPATDLNMRRFTPSFVYAFADFLLNYSALRMCGSYYLQPWSRPDTDYYLSPVLTPSSLLSRFPPTAIFCCERDPLCDDARRFALGLLAAGGSVQVYFFKHLCHGQLNFAIDNFSGLPQARRYEQTARELLRRLISQ